MTLVEILILAVTQVPLGVLVLSTVTYLLHSHGESEWGSGRAWHLRLCTSKRDPLGWLIGPGLSDGCCGLSEVVCES